MWAGNSGTQPAAGNGTCGSSTLSNTLSGASYSNAFVSTHLGQLWQGPFNGGTQYQYLYYSSSQPHQLTGLYATGTTCSNKTGPVYTSSYDSWGNVTSRTYSGTTATLSYDLLDHFTPWYVSSTDKEQYAYDAAGERVLRRSKVPRSERVSWNRQTRADYIREWYQAGYPEPNGGWGIYDIHHILPKEYGGTNDFWNLVPIDSDFHDQVVTPWWKAYNP